MSIYMHRFLKISHSFFLTYSNTSLIPTLTQAGTKCLQALMNLLWMATLLFILIHSILENTE